MNFLDLFSGIGGFRLGMEQAGHKCIGYVEFDKFARKSYQAMHDTKGEWTAHDITGVTDDDIRQLRDRGRVGKGVAQTLDTQCNQATLTSDYRIRRLTPKECWRLQGFPDELFEKAREVNSDSQLYKQAGNGVTVNVIYEIAKKLRK